MFLEVQGSMDRVFYALTLHDFKDLIIEMCHRKLNRQVLESWNENQNCSIRLLQGESSKLR